MKNLVSIIAVVCVLIWHVAQATEDKPTSDEHRKNSVEKSNKILTDLYHVLRNIAFPKSPYSNSATVHNRFILMSPGKVLNYDDYYPGDEYTASLKKKNMSAPYALVPPSVMEKWFDMADVVVGGEVNSGDTGKSLALIYTSIISQITIKDFKTLFEGAEARYNEAKKYLTEPIQNPVNVTENTTRMNLYSIYQNEYAERRLHMEDKINEARQTKSSLEYQLWFQRHYQTLNAKVKSAYTKWLVFGNKEQVELYKTFMDVSSASAALEEVRVALRASAVTSLDRTRTIYPVSFEPSNWYEYLLVREPPTSRDMLVTKRSMLYSELDTLNDFSKPGGQELAKNITRVMKERVTNATKKRENATIAAIETRNECMIKNMGNATSDTTGQNDPCKKLKEKENSAINEAYKVAGTTSEYLSVSFLLKTDENYKSYMRSRIEAVKRDIAEINDQLDNLNGDQVYLGEIVESPEFNEREEQDLDSQWLKFDYNSEVSDVTQEEQSTSTQTSVSVSVPIKAVVVSAGVNVGVNNSEMQEDLSSANLRASGELLRVFIKRPWFKPSLFDNPIFNFVQRDSESGKTAYVSPPPVTEREFPDIINGKHHNTYLMPEYVTSFLMARNVRLEYTGLDSNTVSKSMEVMVGIKVGISPNIGMDHKTMMFGVSAGLDVKTGKRSMSAHRTANGMVIEIPGAQVIGYYTQVMPEFPKQQT